MERSELSIISEDEIKLHAVRLTKFITAATNFGPEHLRVLGEAKGSLVENEEFKWRRLLGIISPIRLEKGGVDQTFLVALNNDWKKRNGGKVDPMEIWLAKGKEIVKGKVVNGKSGYLLIDCVKIGDLYLESSEADKNFVRSNGEYGEFTIHLTSTVVLSPSI